MKRPRRPAVRTASLSAREALLFEAGIKLGGVFHQYLGIPVAPATAADLARTIERAVRLQPYVHAVRVRIEPSRGGPVGRGRFGYRYLTAEMLDVAVELRRGAARVHGRLTYRPELRYPLMWVERAGAATGALRSGSTRGRSARRTGNGAGSGAGRRTLRGRAPSTRRRGSPRRRA